MGLIPFYATHAFNQKLIMFFLDVILLLAIHGLYILLLTLLFKRFVSKFLFTITFQSSFLPYAVAIFLVVLTHVVDIFVLAVILDSMQVIPDPLTTFHFVSGMYTTIGYSYNLEPEWRSLPMMISFCGLFAISISGTGLFSMLQCLVNPPNNAKNPKNN